LEGFLKISCVAFERERFVWEKVHPWEFDLLARTTFVFFRFAFRVFFVVAFAIVALTGWSFFGATQAPFELTLGAAL
jgi:hypothetical protein